MVDRNELLLLLRRSAYLDGVIHNYRESGDPQTFLWLLDDPDYSDILISKFFYSDKDSLIRDAQDFALLNQHIQSVTANMNCWFNCICSSQTHVNSEIRILFVFSGRCICRFDGQTVSLEAGDTCIVPPGITFMHTGLGEDCLLVHALISPSYFNRQLLPKLPTAGIIPSRFCQLITDPVARRTQIVKAADAGDSPIFLLHALYEMRYKKMYYHEAVESYLVLFITEILRSMTASTQLDHFARNASDKRMIDIRHYIDLHFADASLASVSAYFHFSPSYLSLFVRKNTGSTFTEIVQQARLEQACRMLLHGTNSISDIATAVGYQNISYFYRLFRQRFGCTPMEYRQQNYGMKEGSPITDNTLPT